MGNLEEIERRTCMKRIAMIAALAAVISGAARAETNLAWIPYAHTNVAQHWWTNATPYTNDVVTNWMAWQAVNWNFQQILEMISWLPTVANNNTWGATNTFLGTVEFDGPVVG